MLPLDELRQKLSHLKNVLEAFDRTSIYHVWRYFHWKWSRKNIYIEYKKYHSANDKFHLYYSLVYLQKWFDLHYQGIFTLCRNILWLNIGNMFINISLVRTRFMFIVRIRCDLIWYTYLIYNMKTLLTLK